MIERMWINQPSRHQTYHGAHGHNVLVDMSEYDKLTGTVRVYFTSGPVVSQIMHKWCLSHGWVNGWNK